VSGLVLRGGVKKGALDYWGALSITRMAEIERAVLRTLGIRFLL